MMKLLPFEIFEPCSLNCEPQIDLLDSADKNVVVIQELQLQLFVIKIGHVYLG